MEPSAPFTQPQPPPPGGVPPEFLADIQSKLTMALQALEALSGPLSRVVAMSFLQQIQVSRYDPDHDKSVPQRTTLAQLLAELNDNVLELTAALDEHSEDIQTALKGRRKKERDGSA